MQRLIFLAALLFFGLTPRAYAQQPTQERPPSFHAIPASAIVQQSPAQQRSEGLEVTSSSEDSVLLQKVLEQHAGGDASAPDTLTEDQILKRISRTYLYQSNFLLAEASGNEAHAERLLQFAIGEVAMLLQQPGIMDRIRFRELYRSVLSDYQRFYGAPDERPPLRRGDIAQLRADMFVAFNGTGVPLLEGEVLPTLQPEVKPEPVETVIDMTINRLVMSSIDYLFRDSDEHLYLWLSRAETYLPMIEEIFAEEGVPDELKYLAMVESGLNPTARSWAGAAGMWQFISATGRAYDLEINHWVDERLDPEKSTRAAARHLRDLYQLFGGDWQLALSGYNCSPGRIKAAMRKHRARLGRKPTFWEIYPDIPAETRNYVPMFIAAALVTSTPESYGVRPVQPAPRYEYDLAPVHGMFPLERIAELAGTDVATLSALNPELKRSVTPPVHDVYYVRLPLGSYERFTERYAQIPAEERLAPIKYTVKRGDVLGKIADQYDISVASLKRTNGIRGRLIHPGQELIIPKPDFGSVDADPVNAPAARVQYARLVRQPIQTVTLPPQSRIRKISTATAPEQKADEDKPVRATRVIYRVRRGDSLGKVAQKYGVSIRELKGWNDLRRNTLRVGQHLYIYQFENEVTSEETGEEQAAERVIYRVRRGDTLGAIAQTFGVSARDLRHWNDLSGSTIHTGQELEIYYE